MKPSKHAAFLDLLRTGMVRVYLDGRAPGVRLPSRFLTEKVVILEYGYNLPKPIEGLEADETGIRAVLSFGGDKQHTYVPWAAVGAMSDRGGYGVAWETGEELGWTATRRHVAVQHGGVCSDCGRDEPTVLERAIESAAKPEPEPPPVDPRQEKLL